MKVINFVVGTLNLFVGSLGFMLSWNWFPAQIFDLPTLNLVEALGLGAVVSFMTLRVTNDDLENDGEVTLHKGLSKLVAYVLIILISFILQLFM